MSDTVKNVNVIYRHVIKADYFAIVKFVIIYNLFLVLVSCVNGSSENKLPSIENTLDKERARD